jgi:hypothetical protein
MIKITKTLATAKNLSAYTDEEAKVKAIFHKDARSFLKALAAELNLTRGTYDIRSNTAGIAVSGEVTLHADTLYVSARDALLGQGLGVLYRSCSGRKDYSGGNNHRISFRDLTDADVQARFIRECASLMSNPR